MKRSDIPALDDLRAFDSVARPGSVRAAAEEQFLTHSAISRRVTKLSWLFPKINDSVARVGIVEGDYHWHKHDDDDEFFFVLSGKLFFDLEDKAIELNPQQGVTISKGVLHRPRAPEKVVMLMVETAAIDPIGDDSAN